MAWLLLRLTEKEAVANRLRRVVSKGLSWLLTPYLETWWIYDARGALDAAKILQRERIEPEVASAFVVQALILAERLAEARAELDAAEQVWRGAGWLAQLNAQYDRAARHADET